MWWGDWVGVVCGLEEGAENGSNQLHSVRALEVPSPSSPATPPPPSQSRMRHPQSCVLSIRPSSAVLDLRHQRRDGLFARCRLGNLRRAKESLGPTTSLAAVTGLHERLRQACILNRISPATSDMSQYSVAPSPSMRIAVAQRLGAAATADGNPGSRDRSGTNSL